MQFGNTSVGQQMQCLVSHCFGYMFLIQVIQEILFLERFEVLAMPCQGDSKALSILKQ